MQTAIVDSAETRLSAENSTDTDLIYDEDRTTGGPQDMTWRSLHTAAKGGPSHQPGSGLEQEDANGTANGEFGDIFDPKCHWKNCDEIFDHQHELVKVYTCNRPI